MNIDNQPTEPTAGDTKPCPYCGESIKVVARKCRHCREYLDEALKAENGRASAPSSIDRMLMPVGRPISAIAAGYLGLVSVIPLFCLPALGFGLYALSVLKKNPELSGRGRAYFGIVMGAIFTLVYGAFFVTFAIVEK